MDDKNLVNGSTALAPVRKPYNPNLDEEIEKLKKAKKERDRALAQNRVKKKAQILGGIVLAFAIGITLIGRYSIVYKMQNNLAQVNGSIHDLNMENENLKVQLIKASNIQQIQDTAKTKLHMITPDKNNIIYSQSTKDYFVNSTEETNTKTKENLIAKIKNILF